MSLFFLNAAYNKYKTIQRYRLFLKATMVTEEMFVLTSKSQKKEKRKGERQSIRTI